MPIARDYHQIQIPPHQMPNPTMENGGHTKVMLNSKLQTFSLLAIKCLLEILMTFPILGSITHCT